MIDPYLCFSPDDVKNVIGVLMDVPGSLRADVPTDESTAYSNPIFVLG
jgi:hypothetical protein